MGGKPSLQCAKGRALEGCPCGLREYRLCYRKAFRAIENANSDKLQGVFGDGAWTNKNRLPDRLLKDLIEHFSSKTLSIENCPEDELGQGYEYLIKKFADDSGHTAQEFYTNRTVVHLMTEMLKPESGESIYDPTCGSAGMLISAIAYLKGQGKEWRNVAVYGQEINALTSAIGRMNLFLHGVKDFTIVNDDTLKNPAFIENGQLKTFDLVLANPPYSISQWDRVAFESDKYGRNFLGVPPQGRADYAFLQHIIKSLNPKTGRCAILFPHGVLFRNEESEMREKMIRGDYLECVIGLGANLFYNSPMEACIVICRMNKTAARRGKVLFINAVNESAGSLSPRVKWQHLQDYEFFLPEMAKQKELAELLWAMDRTKQAYKQLISATDELVKSQFIEMFGDIKSNPMNLPIHSLGDVCTVERGGSPRPIDKFVTDSADGLNWIKIGDADGSRYISRTAEKIRPEGLKKSRWVVAGDLILSNSMSFGHPYILKIDGCIHDGWLVLHFDERLFDALFLQVYLELPSTYQQFSSMAAGGVVNNLNSELVRKLPVFVPDIIVQKQFAAFVRQTDKSKFALQLTGSNLNLWSSSETRKLIRSRGL